MPTTPGNEVKTVADIIYVLTKCSPQQANYAESELCKSPGGVATLAMACGISSGAIAMGGKITVAGLATGGTLSLGGVVLGGVGLIGATKYCKTFVDQAVGSINLAHP